MPDLDKAAVRSERRHNPPKAARIVLPVWGKAYVSSFLDYYLPTLLAPGNVPAVSGTLPTRFVLLTSADGAPVIAGHPAWQRLNELCPAEMQPIDDLVTSSNHSTTITLAYAREVTRMRGEMTDTVFFFLTSDYLMADGSLRAVLERIRAGASGVLAGNFQIDEAAVDLLYPDSAPSEVRPAPDGSTTRRGSLPVVASFTSRELVGFGLAHLHPATTANIVNFPACYNANMNRLFWRIDRDTMIGRFYLMHMIAIRPEVDDFEISSSSDYAFIPEMCPSDDVEMITDSDEYFVLEAQPRTHDAESIRPGFPTVDMVASSLSEWTIARHRRNSDATLVYHAGELPPDLARVAAEADAFIGAVNTRLKQPPEAHRDHPYWIGAIASHHLYTGQKLDGREVAKLVEITSGARGSGQRLTGLQAWLTGRPPRVRAWQTRFLDYCVPFAKLEALPRRAPVLLVTNDFLPFLDWIGDRNSNAVGASLNEMLAQSAGRRAALGRRFDACLVHLSEEDLERADGVPVRLAEVVRPGGIIVLVAMNGRTRRHREFGRAFARNAARFVDANVELREVDFVGASKLRILVQRRLERLARALIRHPVSSALPAAVIGPCLLLASLGFNLAERRSIRRMSAPRFCSSVTMVFAVPAATSARGPGVSSPASVVDDRLAAPPPDVVPA